MSARDAFLEIVQGAQVLDDVATGVVEENLAVLVDRVKTLDDADAA